ncbi:hypothetical protein DER46DRAFT_591693 [Fusarium sp. MPI-SDFR-AT-0072]|nr:hypothetical protein DER46DRAFT_591693 [Fusarium sp. MPI-SDFR-AT-0072]
MLLVVVVISMQIAHTHTITSPLILASLSSSIITKFNQHNPQTIPSLASALPCQQYQYMNNKYSQPQARQTAITVC